MNRNIIALALAVTLSVADVQKAPPLPQHKMEESCKDGKLVGPGCDYLLTPPKNMTLGEFMAKSKPKDVGK